MKKILALMLALIAMVTLLAACGEEEKEPLSTAEVVEIVLADAGLTIDQAQPHVHAGNYAGQECYYIYITVDGENVAYAVDPYTGEILNIADSDHSH